MGGSLALAAATAVAFSGSLVIFSLCRAHLSHAADAGPAPDEPLRPCLSSSGTYVRYDAPRPAARFSPRRGGLGGVISHAPFCFLACSAEKRQRGGRARRGKAEKRVRFAADVVDNEGAPRPTRTSPPAAAASSAAGTCRGAAGPDERMVMPANREALYRGMLRDRSAHRVTCSY